MFQHVGQGMARGPGRNRTTRTPCGIGRRRTMCRPDSGPRRGHFRRAADTSHGASLFQPDSVHAGNERAVRYVEATRCEALMDNRQAVACIEGGADVGPHLPNKRNPCGWRFALQGTERSEIDFPQFVEFRHSLQSGSQKDAVRRRKTQRLPVRLQQAKTPKHSPSVRNDSLTAGSYCDQTCWSPSAKKCQCGDNIVGNCQQLSRYAGRSETETESRSGSGT